MTNTTLIQAALDDDDTLASRRYAGIYLSGKFLTNTLTYRGKAIVGAGPKTSALMGMPSPDILRTDTTLGQEAIERAAWRDFALVVDDSVDASASFPRPRESRPHAALTST